MIGLKGLLERIGYTDFVFRLRGFEAAALGENLELSLEVVVQESVDMPFASPDKPVEAGFSISDNVSTKAVTFNIVAVSNRSTWKAEKAMLIQMANAKKPIKYYSPIDKFPHESMLIEGLSFDPSTKQKHGFTANFRLKKIRTVYYPSTTSEIVEDPGAPQDEETTGSDGGNNLTESGEDSGILYKDGVFKKAMADGSLAPVIDWAKELLGGV